MHRERLIYLSQCMYVRLQNHIAEAKTAEIIRFDNDESHIKVNVKKNDMNYRIDMHLKKNKPKGIAVN